MKKIKIVIIESLDSHTELLTGALLGVSLANGRKTTLSVFQFPLISHKSLILAIGSYQ